MILVKNQESQIIPQLRRKHLFKGPASIIIPCYIAEQGSRYHIKKDGNDSMAVARRLRTNRNI